MLSILFQRDDIINSIKIMGIDRVKSVFQVCIWMNGGSIAFTRKISAQDNKPEVSLIHRIQPMRGSTEKGHSRN
jgi:hypothetical protein